MASNASSGSARTTPKGQPTRSRSERVGGRSFLSSRAQWLIVIAAVLVVLAAIFYFGRDVTGAGGGQLGAPTENTGELDATLLSA